MAIARGRRWPASRPPRGSGRGAGRRHTWRPRRRPTGWTRRKLLRPRRRGCG
jgi:hypothetical protein